MPGGPGRGSVRAKLPPVRSLRVFLLLLLVALLPLRGSLAATLLCHEGAPRGHAEAVEHGHAHAEASALHQHHDPVGTADKCNVCSGLTSPACPFEAIPAVAIAAVQSELVPQPTLWPASVVAARLKRPPRTA